MWFFYCGNCQLGFSSKIKVPQLGSAWNLLARLGSSQKIPARAHHYCVACKNQFWNGFLQTKNPVRWTWFFQLAFSKFKYRSTGGQSVKCIQCIFVCHRVLHWYLVWDLESGLGRAGFQFLSHLGCQASTDYEQLLRAVISCFQGKKIVIFF